jgi:large subunit ribosomal protein L25
VEGAGPAKGMIVDWQNEPIKGTLLHIDIKRIAMNKAMRVSIPVQLTGTATGVKNGGGVLSQVLHEVEIECLPDDIPGHIDVDVTGLNVNDAVHVKDLPHNDKIKFLGNEDAMVAHVTMAKEEVVEETAVAAATEPEVAKKGKQDAEATEKK